ncbi:succinate dehydrogenase flavoprotein subunit [Acetonema longum]|uniref:succinate dehydrogenase n=1 Tax=Acetonema longum DSM 6540 TaxID=1009370 RepID=F7NKH9_9FIRM|nr:succinate dehydrogenase flavoprotein subunit [Acetonema longum]EGO63431.1 succinate dehydrogenase flavoprotein subunit [Acetonema longum DSM 6540]
MSIKFIVIGGGAAGLTATMRIAEQGHKVDLFSIVPVKRSHTGCAQGGINAAMNTKGQGDSTQQHFIDTVVGGDFLANQPPVKALCDAAPGVIHMLDRMGMMFTRTSEGILDLRPFGGTKHKRTAFSGATTGQQLLYTLDEQVRRYEDKGLVKKYEGWEFLSAVLDEAGECRGIVAQHLSTMEIEVFAADAVILATGGIGMVFGRSTNGTISTGSAASIAYQQGAYYANGEFIQIHPTALPGEDKRRLMSESARGDGGRIWTYKDGKPWYFLEEWYPAYGNLVPRDVAARAIFKVCVEMGLGIDGKNIVYLDVSHIDSKELDRKLGGILEIYEKFIGEDPRKVPMKIFPSMHYTMGGLWTDYSHMTSIPGLFAAGECDYMYHGANRLGGNSLMSATYSGMVAGPAAVNFVKGRQRTPVSSALLEAAKQKEIAAFEQLMKMNGTENPYVIHREMGDWMTENVTIQRFNAKLQETDNKLQELEERWEKVGVSDHSCYSNQVVMFTRQLHHMLKLSRVITQGALRRNESRGSHFKPEFPERDDENWLKTTKAAYSADGPVFSYEPVDTSLLAPRARRYDVDNNSAAKKEAK